VQTDEDKSGHGHANTARQIPTPVKEKKAKSEDFDNPARPGSLPPVRLLWPPLRVFNSTFRVCRSVSISQTAGATESLRSRHYKHNRPCVLRTSESAMSTYTPCFPPTDVVPSGKRRPISSSNSSGTSSVSESHSSPKPSYSARLSRSYLALASVSEYVSRAPSPTSAAVDTKRVTQLRRKFRLAVDATYRDTSSGKWGHVSEMAKLGSTRGRWQGMCSGSSAPRSLYKAQEQKHQGECFK